MLGNKNRLLLQSIKTFTVREATGKLRKLVQKAHPADLGLVFNHLRPSEALGALNVLPSAEIQGEVLAETGPDLAAEILYSLTPNKISQILQEMYSDDAAQILERFEESLREEVLREMAEDEQNELERRFEYDEETAGRIMVPDFLALAPETTVQEAIQALQSAEDLELVYYLYVVSETGQLIGIVSLRQLLLVEPTTTLRNIMVTDLIAVKAEDDQEDVARRVARYNLVAIPVVDDLGKMLGIVTVDDVIDIIKEEATEDMLRLAGMGEEDPILSGSVLKSVRLRSPWLLASCLGGLLTFFITKQFEDLLSQAVLLAGFIPIVLGMGGNVGTQTSTLMVRSLAVRGVDGTQLFRVLFRELRVGFLLGLLYGSLVGTVVLLLNLTGVLHGATSGGSMVSAIAGLGLIFSMMVAAIIGTAVPLILDRLGVDPAIATGPFVTTSVDVLGVVTYFSIATALLHLS